MAQTDIAYYLKRLLDHTRDAGLDVERVRAYAILGQLDGILADYDKIATESVTSNLLRRVLEDRVRDLQRRIGEESGSVRAAFEVLAKIPVDRQLSHIPTIWPPWERHNVTHV